MRYVEIDNNSFFVDADCVVGIFDLDNTTTNRHTNAFLSRAAARGKAVYLGSDIPKSFILMTDGTVITAEPAASVLRRRFEE